MSVPDEIGWWPTHYPRSFNLANHSIEKIEPLSSILFDSLPPQLIVHIAFRALT